MLEPKRQASPTKTVREGKQMDETKYRERFEKEQIEFIKNFLVDVCRVSKTKQCLTPIAYCNGDSVAISVDIRPWEEEYVIEL